MDTTSPNSPVATTSQQSTNSTVPRDPLVADLVKMLRAKGVAAGCGDEIPKMVQRRGNGK